MHAKSFANANEKVVDVSSACRRTVVQHTTAKKTKLHKRLLIAEEAMISDPGVIMQQKGHVLSRYSINNSQSNDRFMLLDYRITIIKDFVVCQVAFNKHRTINKSSTKDVLSLYIAEEELLRI